MSLHTDSSVVVLACLFGGWKGKAASRAAFRSESESDADYSLPFCLLGLAFAPPLASPSASPSRLRLRPGSACAVRVLRRPASRSLGRDVDFLGARRVDGDDRVIVAAGERDERDAFGHLDVREVVDLVQLERRDVELEVLGQEARQAAHFDVGQQVIDDAALVLDALGLGFADEVDADGES